MGGETVPLSARIPPELDDALRQLAHQRRTSKSEVVRRCLSKCIEDEEDLADDLQKRVKRERLKQKNDLTWQKIHFRSNTADRFRRAFEQGDLAGPAGDESIADLAEIQREDARLLFEDAERREANVAYVEAVAEAARDATDASEFSSLEPQEMFQQYAGVIDGQADEQPAHANLEVLVEDAQERIEHLQHNPATAGADPDAVADALRKEHGVDESMAQEAVEAALNGGVD
jgi:predicted DNA-binding protein